MAEEKKNTPDNMSMESIASVSVVVSAVLGKTVMQIESILALRLGSVIELNRKVGEQIELYANDKLIAKGEIIILDDTVGITLTDIVKEQ